MQPAVLRDYETALENNFSAYIQAFLPFLYPALKAHEDTQLCMVAVGIIGDVSRALGSQSSQYAGAFMTVLLENLQSEVLNRNVKISILSCFGDIALAIGIAFEPYLEATMGVLRQAGAVQPNPVSAYFCDLVQIFNTLMDTSLTSISSITSLNFVRASWKPIRALSLVSRAQIKVCISWSIPKHLMTVLFKSHFFCRIHPLSLTLSSVVSPMMRGQNRQYGYVSASSVTLRTVSILVNSNNSCFPNGLRLSYAISAVCRPKQKRPCVGLGR